MRQGSFSLGVSYVLEMLGDWRERPQNRIQASSNTTNACGPILPFALNRISIVRSLMQDLLDKTAAAQGVRVANPEKLGRLVKVQTPLLHGSAIAP